MNSVRLPADPIRKSHYVAQHVEQLYLTIYKLTWFERWQSITFSDLSELSDVLDFTFDQGRGTGVRRGLGVGEHLPMHGVGVGVGVGAAPAAQ